MGNTQSGAGADITENHKPSGSLYLVSDQMNLVNGIETKVALAHITTGFTDGIEDTVNNKITPAVAGLYHIIGSIEFINLVVAKQVLVIVDISDGSIRLQKYGHTNHTGALTISVDKYEWLSAANYLELRAMQACGVDTVDITGCANTFLEVQRVR